MKLLRTKSRTELPPCVVLAGGALGSGLGLIRSLGARRVPVHVVAPNDAVPIYASSRFCASAATMPDLNRPDAFLEQVAGVGTCATGREKPVLFALNDRLVSLIAANRDRWAEHFTLSVPSSNIAQALIDKNTAHHLAIENGLCVPASAFVTSREDLDQTVGAFDYPVILKPTSWKTRGRRTFKTAFANSKEEHLQIASGLLEQGAVLQVQEYIGGDDTAVEVFIFYRSGNGRVAVGCSGRKLLQAPRGAGLMAIGQAVELPHVVEASHRFLERIDYTGVGGLEFKRRGERSYFIEASVRLDGFHPLAIQAGIDVPWLAYQDLALGVAPAASNGTQANAYWVDEPVVADVWKDMIRDPKSLWRFLRVAGSWKTRMGLTCMRDPAPLLRYVGRRIGRCMTGRRKDGSDGSRTPPC